MRTVGQKLPRMLEGPMACFMRTHFAIASSTFACGALTGAACAGPLEAACYADIEKYCTGGERGTALKACLLQHETLVSRTCQPTMAGNLPHARSGHLHKGMARRGPPNVRPRDRSCKTGIATSHLQCRHARALER